MKYIKQENHLLCSHQFCKIHRQEWTWENLNIWGWLIQDCESVGFLCFFLHMFLCFLPLITYYYILFYSRIVCILWKNKMKKIFSSYGEVEPSSLCWRLALWTGLLVFFNSALILLFPSISPNNLNTYFFFSFWKSPLSFWSGSEGFTSFHQLEGPTLLKSASLVSLPIVYCLHSVFPVERYQNSCLSYW